ncbi:MAG: hypothetical protein VKP72_02675 [bacterium]|nr:hypothetical protein [bacterium]
MAISNNYAQPSPARLQTMLPTANSDNLAGMRLAAPVVNTLNQVRMARDTFQGSSAIASGMRMMDDAGGMMSGGMPGMGGVGSRIGSGIKGIFGGGFRSFFSALKTNFVVSAVLSGISNIYELATGKVKPLQAAGNFIADTATYTGIGAAATTIGGLVGSLIPIPFLGTALGVAAGAGVGLLLGKLYEDNVRTSFSGTVQQGIQSLMDRTEQPPAVNLPGNPAPLPTGPAYPTQAPQVPMQAPVAP